MVIHAKEKHSRKGHNHGGGHSPDTWRMFLCVCVNYCFASELQVENSTAGDAYVEVRFVGGRFGSGCVVLCCVVFVVLGPLPWRRLYQFPPPPYSLSLSLSFPALRMFVRLVACPRLDVCLCLLSGLARTRSRARKVSLRARSPWPFPAACSVVPRPMHPLGPLSCTLVLCRLWRMWRGH